MTHPTSTVTHTKLVIGDHVDEHPPPTVTHTKLAIRSVTVLMTHPASTFTYTKLAIRDYVNDTANTQNCLGQTRSQRWLILVIFYFRHSDDSCNSCVPFRLKRGEAGKWITSSTWFKVTEQHPVTQLVRDSVFWSSKFTITVRVGRVQLPSDRVDFYL